MDLSQNNLQCELQHGFRDGMTTLFTLMETVEEITTAIKIKTMH